MPEDNKNKNFDSFLDDNIRNSLSYRTSEDFIFEMAKRVELENEFHKEDVKTQKIAKYVIGGFVTFLAAFSFMFAFALSSNSDSKDAGFFSGLIGRFTNLIESISIFTTENLGFAFDFQTGMVILLAMICIVVFSIADKVIIKKGYK
jgi:hypothetical protein